MSEQQIEPKVNVDEILRELEEYGRREGGMWNVGPEGGAFLAWLIRLLNAKRVLEIGTSNGYSAIWMARALRETGGELVTLEMDERKIAMAHENLARAGLDRLVTIVEGPATTSLQVIGGTFDLVLIDADKSQYTDYLHEIRRLVAPGSIIVADNLTTHLEELDTYHSLVKQDTSFDTVAISIGGGFLVTRIVA